jgi:hypothetical protein
MMTSMLNRSKFVLALLTIAGLSAMISAQENQTQKAFAGTWEGKFKGAVFCVLKLEPGEKISGTLSPGTITVNDDGDITDAQPSEPEPSGKELPILNPKIGDRKLSFDWKDTDDDTSKFELKITGEGEAQLRLIEFGDHIKPIILRRR